MPKSAIVLLMAILFKFCSDTATSPLGGLTANTDKSSYTAGEPVAISLQNGTSKTAYFGHCAYRVGFYVQGKDNTLWKDTSSVAVICLAIYPSGIRPLAAGEEYRDTLFVQTPGIYRLRFPFGWEDTNTNQESIYSDQFVVE